MRLGPGTRVLCGTLSLSRTSARARARSLSLSLCRPERDCAWAVHAHYQKKIACERKTEVHMDQNHVQRLFSAHYIYV
jgi:hypothetical protein